MDAKSLRYIIRFLLGNDLSSEVASSIGYTSNKSLFHKYNIVIIPSGFFNESLYGQPASLPTLPLQEIEGIPLLFGKPETETIGATLVVKADIIASTYFLITRYEEMIRRQERDQYGRFPGKKSLPYRAGFIDRPIIDEYRILLRKWLRQTHLNIPDINKGIHHIWLTHDVDAPFLYRSWKGLIRSVRDGRGLRTSFSGKWGSCENDPYYTFPWIFQQDNLLQKAKGKKQCHITYFLKGGGRSRLDKPHYNLHHPDLQYLLDQININQGDIGLHTSYDAGEKPSLIKKDKQTLEKATGRKIIYNRHHFLACREPEDMLYLEAAGITHDFTMGYADVAGFRLSTSRPVQWINPATRRLYPLLLHPLHIMDCTIEESRYMGLTYEEGSAYCLQLIEKIEQTGGELSLLWHNTVLQEGEKGKYQRSLYTRIINQLLKK